KWNLQLAQCRRSSPIKGTSSTHLPLCGTRYDSRASRWRRDLLWWVTRFRTCFHRRPAPTVRCPQPSFHRSVEGVYRSHHTGRCPCIHLDLHSEPCQRFPCRRLVEELLEGCDSGAIRTRFRNNEIVLLVAQRQKAEAGIVRNRVQRESPVRAALRDCGGNGVVISRLDGISDGLYSFEQAIDERSCPAPLIAVDHDACRIAFYCRHRLLRRLAFE